MVMKRKLKQMIVYINFESCSKVYIDLKGEEKKNEIGLFLATCLWLTNSSKNGFVLWLYFQIIIVKNLIVLLTFLNFKVELLLPREKTMGVCIT